MIKTESVMRDLIRTTGIAAVLCFFCVSIASANSFTEDAFGSYNGDECGVLNDMTLLIEPGVFQFHETSCEVQGEEWQQNLLINVNGNGSLLVESPDGSFSVVYQFCG